MSVSVVGSGPAGKSVDRMGRLVDRELSSIQRSRYRLREGMERRERTQSS